MNREQRKYFTDRIDSELNKALTELQMLRSKCRRLYAALR